MANMNGTTTPQEAEVSSSPEELYIRRDIYDAAMKRAMLQGATLASVTRSCYFAAAALAVPVEGGKDAIKPRTYGEDRERIRFRVPADSKKSARARIEASGISVPAAVEALLRTYVETGTIVSVAAAPETAATEESE